MRAIWDRILGIVWLCFAVFGVLTDSSTSWVMSCLIVGVVYSKSAEIKKAINGGES